jgi:hypothetical protein
VNVGRVGTPGVGQPRYDRNFEEVVREGILSVPEAIRRGNRQAYAEHLRQRYRLTDELALRITDNRVRLTEVLRATGRIPGHPKPRGGINAPVLLQMLALIFGLGTLAGLFGLHQWQRQHEMGRRLESLQVSAPRIMVPQAQPLPTPPLEVPRVSIERDERGRITRVSAGHPADVLAALCNETTGSCQSMEILQNEPPFPGRRLGRFAVTHSVAQSASIPIRRDRRSGRWVAGTGLDAITVMNEAGVGEPTGTDLDGSRFRCGFRDGSDCVIPPRTASE